jgi:hypothetical protein
LKQVFDRSWMRNDIYLFSIHFVPHRHYQTIYLISVCIDLFSIYISTNLAQTS